MNSEPWIVTIYCEDKICRFEIASEKSMELHIHLAIEKAMEYFMARRIERIERIIKELNDELVIAHKLIRDHQITGYWGSATHYPTVPKETL